MATRKPCKKANQDPNLIRIVVVDFFFLVDSLLKRKENCINQLDCTARQVGNFQTCDFTSISLAEFSGQPNKVRVSFGVFLLNFSDKIVLWVLGVQEEGESIGKTGNGNIGSWSVDTGVSS